MKALLKKLRTLSDAELSVVAIAIEELLRDRSLRERLRSHNDI